LIRKAFKAVSSWVKGFFKEEEKEKQEAGFKVLYEHPSNVIPFAPRPRVAPAPAVRVEAPPAPAPVRSQVDRRKEYKQWIENAREYDKLRQKLAQ
jgi:hypothetical protein